jgi:hypothetical protein
MSDPMYDAVPPGGYSLDYEERLEQARIAGEQLSMADQVVYDAIKEARLRRKENDIQNQAT